MIIDEIEYGHVIKGLDAQGRILIRKLVELENHNKTQNSLIDQLHQSEARLREQCLNAEKRIAEITRQNDECNEINKRFFDKIRKLTYRNKQLREIINGKRK